MAGGRKGRTKAWKEEGSDPRSELKGAEKSNIDPKICWKRVPESIKIVQKSTQKGPKKKPRDTQKSQQRLQDDLGPPWGAISRLSWPGQVPSWVPKSSQIRKKTDAKNRWFFDRSWKRKKWEKGVQNHSKIESKMVENRAHKERQDENGKSVKTNNTLWF